MTQFSTNTHRLDPYKNFKFLVKWENEAVAGLSKMSAVKWTKAPRDRRGGWLGERNARPEGATAGAPAPTAGHG